MSHYTSLTSVFLTPAPQVLCAGARLHQIVSGSQQEIHGLAFAVMESLLSLLRMHWDPEPPKNGSARCPHRAAARRAGDSPPHLAVRGKGTPPKIGRELGP